MTSYPKSSDDDIMIWWAWGYPLQQYEYAIVVLYEVSAEIPLLALKYAMIFPL
jgi:hypothetical protein